MELFCSKFTYLLFFSLTDFLHHYLSGKPSITQRAVASQLVLIANAYNPGKFELNRDEILLYCETHKAAESRILGWDSLNVRHLQKLVSGILILFYFASSPCFHIE